MRENYRQFLIRNWQKSDRFVAAEVIRQVLAEYDLPWQPNVADLDVLEVEKFYLARQGEFWVVELAGEIVGTAAYYPLKNKAERATKEVEIRKMYLLPQARNQGLGTYLLIRLEETIQKRGFNKVLIETASCLQEAVILYEKNNYQPLLEVATERCDRAYYKDLK